MRIDSMLASGKPVFSFEFFPPKTSAGVRSLFDTISDLQPLEPSFVSVTYGAGGSTRTRTVELVERIRRELDMTPAAHLTCVGATAQELRAVLRELVDAGIENVLALRGDPPTGESTFTIADGGLARGCELAELIRNSYDLCIGCACYPENHVESRDPGAELSAMRAKVDAGAAFLVTQLFFDNPTYFDFLGRARAAGIQVPIIPGIMPITNVEQIQRFTERIGATIPVPLLDALQQRREDPDAVLQLGVAWATLQCAELLAGGAPGVHFYTLNRSPATRAILSALRAARPWDRVR